jgi:hypothetical protein
MLQKVVNACSKPKSRPNPNASGMQDTAPDGLRLDRNAALALHLQLVQVLRSAATRYGKSKLHQPVAECALAMIDVRNDAQVPSAFARYRLENICSDVSKADVRRRAAETPPEKNGRPGRRCVEARNNSSSASAKHQNAFLSATRWSNCSVV